MEIKLFLNGETKTFTQPFVSGRALRRSFEYENEFQKLLDQAGDDNAKYDRLKDLDLAAQYVSEMFGNQFTPEQFLEGTPSHEIISEFARIKHEVHTGLKQAMGKDESDPNA